MGKAFIWLLDAKIAPIQPVGYMRVLARYRPRSMCTIGLLIPVSANDIMVATLETPLHRDAVIDWLGRSRQHSLHIFLNCSAYHQP
jgi:hypothetical protein